MIIDTSQLTTEDNYIDGNRLVYKNKKCHCKIIFKGTGNVIEIGDNVTLPNTCAWTLSNNCEIKIFDNVSIIGSTPLLFDNSKLIIGKNVKFHYLKRLRVLRNAEVIIGENTTIGGALQ